MDMTRLNDLIEQNGRRRAEFENKIRMSVMEFEREVSELNQQSIGLEGQISEMQSNRTKILIEINEDEEQIKMWEKKIKVERETQEELHTSKDAIDTKGMEREIQKMKRRLASLVTTQEQLLRDMELAIRKREDIAVKYKNTKNHQKKSQGQSITKGEQAKKIQHTMSKLEKLERSIQEATQSVVCAREELSAIRLVLRDTSDQLNSFCEDRKSLEKEVAESEFAKNRMISLCALYKEVLQRYESLDKGDVPPVSMTARTEFEVEKKMLAAKTRMETISSIISDLSTKFDEYKDIFDRMSVILYAIPFDRVAGTHDG